MQLVKGLPHTVKQVHLSREQGGPRSSGGSSMGAQVSQHPLLQEQHYQALSSSEQPPASPAQSSSSEIESPTAPSSFRQVPEPSTAPMPAAANARRQASDGSADGLSLAADLADAISAVNLTDVLTDDSPFKTAKVWLRAASVNWIPTSWHHEKGGGTQAVFAVHAPAVVSAAGYESFQCPGDITEHCLSTWHQPEWCAGSHYQDLGMQLGDIAPSGFVRHKSPSNLYPSVLFCLHA